MERELVQRPVIRRLATAALTIAGLAALGAGWQLMRAAARAGRGR